MLSESKRIADISVSEHRCCFCSIKQQKFLFQHQKQKVKKHLITIHYPYKIMQRYRCVDIFFYFLHFSSLTLSLIFNVSLHVIHLWISYNQIMSKLTLGYYKSRGRAQIPRLLLAYTGVAFEDVQYKDPQQWFGKDKQSLNLEFPNLPYLIDGDFRLTETRAICQYIVERAKRSEQLLGKNIKERARILMTIEVINDVLQKINEIIYDQQVNKKRENIFKDFISPKLKQLVNFRGNRQFLFDRLTMADFVLAELSYYVESVFPSEYKNLQFLQEIRTKFNALPEIKSYYEREEAVKGPFTNLEKATIKF